MVSEKSAGVVVFRMDGGPVYLLLHYGAGHWDFPKGHMEAGESEEQTSLRETTEETGISDLTFFPGFRLPVNYTFRRGNDLVEKEVVFFIAETKTKEVKISFEHKGYKWVTYDAALKKLTFENAKEVLRKANERINKILG